MQTDTIAEQAAEQPPSALPHVRRCIGMVADSENKLIPCPELVPTQHRSRYHSRKCSQWTRSRLWVGWKLGDIYRKGKRYELEPLGPCPGWTIRDGVIVICGESRSDYASRMYHRKCPDRKSTRLNSSHL